MTLDELNALPAEVAHAAFERCCGATAWADSMCAARPFPHREALHERAEQSATRLGRRDWLQAFAQHPRIGDLASLRERFATSEWAGQEQRGAAVASDDTLSALQRGNRAYEQRFGHIFIVCATGKTAAEMLAILESRLGNDPDRELAIAAGEQVKITRLRLDKLVEDV